jgi:hypothetical protein
MSRGEVLCRDVWERTKLSKHDRGLVTVSALLQQSPHRIPMTSTSSKLLSTQTICKLTIIGSALLLKSIVRLGDFAG